MNYEHDRRLDKLKVGQYRIWYDGQDILVPKGQSITKPLMPEKVQTNTRVYGEIHNGYFKKPIVDFTNTNVNINRFDKYYLQTWRNGDDLPFDNTDIDYYDDLGLLDIQTRINVVLNCDNFYGFYTGKRTVFHHLEDHTWETDILHVSNFSQQGLEGNFYFVVNPLMYHYTTGIMLNTAKFLHENLPIFLVLTELRLKNGNSFINLLNENEEYSTFIESVLIEILGGE